MRLLAILVVGAIGAIVTLLWLQPAPEVLGFLYDVKVKACRKENGVVVDVAAFRKNSVLKSRKFWDSGRTFASGWIAVDEAKAYNYPEATCDKFPVGFAIRTFEKHNQPPEPVTPFTPVPLEYTAF